MGTDLILALYFFRNCCYRPLLIPSYTLPVFGLQKKSVIELTGIKISLMIIPIHQYPAELKLCSYIASIVSFIQNSCKHLMPQKVGKLKLDLGEKPEDECKHIPINCPWTITSKRRTQHPSKPV